MSTKMQLGAVDKDGMAQIFARVQFSRPKVNILQKTGLIIAPKIWDNQSDTKYMDRFRKNDSVMRTLRIAEEIRIALNSRHEDGGELNAAIAREIINGIVYKDEIDAKLLAEEMRKKAEVESKRMTLRKYIDLYRKEIADGTRLTGNGRVFAYGTVNAINQACERLKKYEESVGMQFDFDDIDMSFYKEYTAYLNQQDYAANTVGKCINVLKTILALAESEGYHHNSIYKDKKFKGAKVDVDTIYLTKEDLDKIRDVDLSNKTYGFDLARDIFLVGVWTAQRVSDYNNIHKKDIETYTKRTIKDVPDPENPGKIMAVVEETERTVIKIQQKKTGTKVAIPCSAELKRILEKYNYNIPHLSDQNINDNIKDIAELAGLTEPIRIQKIKGGKDVVEWIPKYELVHTHTARRTGATLMYLAGMDIFDIMKITGHSTPQMLKRYIKADELEVVDKIADKYDYFD